MVFGEVDPLAELVVSAIFERDHSRILSAIGEETQFGIDGQISPVAGLEAWLTQSWPSGMMQIQTGKILARGSRHVLDVVGCSAGTEESKAILSRMQWAITVLQARVVKLEMVRITTMAVPQVIVSHIKATNEANLSMLLDTFAEDAVVNDQLRDYWGKTAIAEWAASEIIGQRISMAVVGIVEHYSSIIITANIDGDYDKRGLPDPLVLAFYFSAQADKIVQLFILRNMVDS